MKLRATLLASSIAAMAAVPARAQASPPDTAPAPAAAPAPTTTPAPAAPRPRVRRNPNVITAAEIEGQIALDVHELVRRLRPQWLRGRASNTNFDMVRERSIPPIFVFVDGNRLGDVNELRHLQVGSVREIRFIPSEDAVTRWGRDFSSGAIEVVSR